MPEELLDTTPEADSYSTLDDIPSEVESADELFSRIQSQPWVHPVTPTHQPIDYAGFTDTSVDDAGTGSLVNYWDLDVTDSGVSVSSGTILADSDDVTTGVSITNIGTVFVPAAGDILYLEFTDASPTTCTLGLGSSWTDYPSRYEVSGTPAAPVFDAYREPIWYFTSDSSQGVVISAGVFGVKVAPPTCFEVINTLFKATTTTQTLIVPKLIPSHEVLPSTIT